MNDRADLPDELLDLLARHVDPMAHAELLLLVHQAPDRVWDAASAAEALRVDVATTAKRLAGLTADGMLRVSGEPPAYQYAPASPALHRAVEQLRVAYDTRPVTLVRALYERPSRAVRSFADAFRVRKPGE